MSAVEFVVGVGIIFCAAAERLVAVQSIVIATCSVTCHCYHARQRRWPGRYAAFQQFKFFSPERQL